MQKYRCYYLNDFRDDYEAMSVQDDYGDWYRVVDVDARIAELERALQAAVDDMRSHSILRPTHPAVKALGLSS